MIVRDNGELCAECNFCGEKLWGGTTDDFQEFIGYVKGEGWKIRKVEDEWQHACPSCAEDGELSN